MYKLNEFVKTHILKNDPFFISWYENEIKKGILPRCNEMYNPFFSPYNPCLKNANLYMNEPFEKFKKMDIYSFNKLDVEWCERHPRWLIHHPYPVSLMEKNLYQLDTWDWFFLSFNPYAIRILEANPDNIHWGGLSANPAGLELLSKCPEDRYIDYDYLIMNSAIYDLDYEAIRERINIFKEELLQKTLHPKRFIRWIEDYGETFDFDEMI
jgi:hypothetical protein